MLQPPDKLDCILEVLWEYVIRIWVSSNKISPSMTLNFHVESEIVSTLTLKSVVKTCNYFIYVSQFILEFFRFSGRLDRKCRRRCLWQRWAISWQCAECGNTFRTLPHHFWSHVMLFRDMSHAGWPVGHPPRASETTAKGGAFKCWRSGWISSWETGMRNFEAN